MYHEHHKHRKHEDMIAWLCTDPHYAVPLPYLYPELSGAVVLGTETVCFRGAKQPVSWDSSLAHPSMASDEAPSRQAGDSALSSEPPGLTVASSVLSWRPHHACIPNSIEPSLRFGCGVIAGAPLPSQTSCALT